MYKKLIIVMVVGMLFLLSACQEGHREETSGNHIHAISFDAQGGGLYLATHHGLEKYEGDQRVSFGEKEYDVMGFVIARDGSFYASGHAHPQGDVGIRKSTDKGLTWETIAYEGRDFHDMVVSHNDPNLIYAWSTPPDEFLTLSKDKGSSWTNVKTDFQKTLFALAADHQQENKLYAGTLFGVSVSEDYGETWTPLDSLLNITTVAIADDPTTEGIMYISTSQRGLLKTTDDGMTWEEMDEGSPNPNTNIVLLITINPNNTKELHAVTKDGSIYFFDGEVWKEV